MKATVAKVTFKKEFSTKNGQMYSWHVTMDNGDMGETATKENTPPWAVGEEAEYNRVEEEYNGQMYVKLKKAFTQGGGKGFGGGGSKWTPDPEKESRKERWAKQIMITRMGCLNTATTLWTSVQSGNLPLLEQADSVKDLAEIFETWVKRGIDLKALVAAPPVVAPAAPAPEPAKAAPVAKPTPVAVDEDDIPF